MTRHVTDRNSPRNTCTITCFFKHMAKLLAEISFHTVNAGSCLLETATTAAAARSRLRVTQINLVPLLNTSNAILHLFSCL
jgi:hypothetical protein